MGVGLLLDPLNLACVCTLTSLSAPFDDDKKIEVGWTINGISDRPGNLKLIVPADMAYPYKLLTHWGFRLVSMQF